MNRNHPYLSRTQIIGFVLLATCLAVPGSAQPVGSETPAPIGLSAGPQQPLAAVAEIALPALDSEQLKADDEVRRSAGLPLRYAVLQPAAMDATKGGSWEALPDGAWLWRLQVRAEGAKGIGPVFDRFRLAEGALLHLYAADGSHRIRPFSKADNKPHGELWAPSVRSDHMVIELFAPSLAARDASEVRLRQVGQAYRDIWNPEGPDKESGSCNFDVVCPEGDGWGNQIRSVGVISIGNTFICTGFLINNTAEDDRPLFMSANHCGISPSNDQSLRVYWNYENSTCRTGPGAGGPGDGTLDQFQIGSTFLASDASSDFVLVELDDSPAPFDTFFLGWDGRDITPARTVGVHHPNTEEKRISFEDDPSERSSYLGASSPGDGSHLRVNDWDLGTTERGSSGSPLIDHSTGRAVGQLHGGFAACGNDFADYYGRIHLALQNGARPFLDPIDSGAQFLDGREAGSGAVCTNDATTLCLNRGRFRVTVDWRDFDDNTGVGRTVDARTDDSGLFWFFGERNWEVLVKVLDACAEPFNRYWVFFAATTNVGYTLTVTDTETDQTKVYENPVGNLAQAVTDTDAFATCP
ncbi:MAG: hypothetical protein MPN21_18370 [Thermoanaerobaculia bacterium]|nr:hypothetical protein [Thermoanaerobaculia bacterium]